MDSLFVASVASDILIALLFLLIGYNTHRGYQRTEDRNFKLLSVAALSGSIVQFVYIELEMLRGQSTQYDTPLGNIMMIAVLAFFAWVLNRLTESESRFKQLADLLPQVVFEVDAKGNFTFLNRVGLASIGYTEEEVRKGLSAFQMFPPEDSKRAMENMQRILTGETVAPSEYTILRKDGSTFPAIIHSNADAGEGMAAGLRGVAIDMTERKRMEEELLRSQRLATVGELAAMVGHDLRNPLQGIMNAVHYLRTHEVSKLDEEGKEMAELIEHDVRRAEVIIGELLDYSRESKLELADNNVKSIAGEALAVVEIPRNVQVIDSTSKSHETMMDAEKIRRVFVNLIENAIDAMPKGGALSILSSRTDDHIQIAFKDTGEGMTRETMEKIWTPLFTTKAKGIGLGLAIVKRFTEAHGGSISVESEPGKGSTFTVILPTRQTKPEPSS